MPITSIYVQTLTYALAYTAMQFVVTPFHRFRASVTHLHHRVGAHFALVNIVISEVAYFDHLHD